MITEAERRRRHAAIREASRAAFASTEFRSVLDEIHANCAAYRVGPRKPPARLDDESFDAALDRAEGGPDVIRSIYG